MLHQSTVFCERVQELTEGGETLGAAIIRSLPVHRGVKLVGDNELRFADGSRVKLSCTEEGTPNLFTSPPV